MQRVEGILLGLGAGLLALVAVFDDSPGLAALLGAALVALHAAGAPRARLSVGGALLGAAGGCMLGLRLTPLHGPLLPTTVGAVLALAALAWSRRSARPAPAPDPASEPPSDDGFGLPAAAAAFGLLFAARGVAATALATTGDDPAARTFVAVPLLLTAGIGAAIARHLHRRHPALRTRLVGVLALAAAAALLLEPVDGADAFALADRIQGPSVTRRHFLYGGALLAGALGGFVVLTLAACLGASLGERRARAARWTLAAALGLAAVLPPTWPYGPTAPPASGLDPIRTATGGAAGGPPPGWPCPPARAPSATARSYALGARTFDELRLAARLAVAELDAPVAVLDASEVHFAPGADAPPARVTHSADAVRELAAAAPAGSAGRLALREGRTRLSPLRPDLGAANLRRLLRSADRLGEDADGQRRRIELSLAAAILDDDAGEEDRLLEQLESLDRGRAEELRAGRRAARAALRELLLAARDEDPADADVRHRLGRLDWKSGRVAAGLEELTRAFELRPKLDAAALDLMEAYLDADAAGYRRWAAGGGRLGNPQTATAVHGIVNQRYGGFSAALEGRVRLALARAGRIEASWPHEADQAEARLRKALGGTGHALLLDPADADAHRSYVLTSLALGLKKGAAARHARDAARLAPLVPEHHLLEAVTARSVEERRAALARALAAGVVDD